MKRLRDFREHVIRYRAGTLQTLDLVTDEQLDWRPGPDHYMLGQLFLHIAQTEDFQISGLLKGDWDYERVGFPSPMPGREGIRTFFEAVRDPDAPGPRAGHGGREKLGGF